MKNASLIILAVVCCVNYSCEQSKFKTVKGEKASYTITIPADFVPRPDNYPIKSKSPHNDLDYKGPNGESVMTAVGDISSNDLDAYLMQLTSLSDSEFAQRLDSGQKYSTQILERKVIDVSGVKSYYVYYHTENFYGQTLYQFNNEKMLKLLYSYHYRRNDSLMPYFYSMITSVVWSNE